MADGLNLILGSDGTSTWKTNNTSQSCPTGGSRSGRLREILRDTIRFWELGRIAHNLVLTAVVIAWLVTTWPHFREALTLRSLVLLTILGLLANVCYSAAYLVDVPMQYSSLRAAWRRWRWGLWLTGTVLATVIANYWIADEIYPFVR